MWIGANPPTATDKPWAGCLDEVRVYDRALEPVEIQALPAPGLAVPVLFADGFESGDLLAWSSVVP